MPASEKSVHDSVRQQVGREPSIRLGDHKSRDLVGSGQSALSKNGRKAAVIFA